MTHEEFHKWRDDEADKYCDQKGADRYGGVLTTAWEDGANATYEWTMKENYYPVLTEIHMWECMDKAHGELRAHLAIARDALENVLIGYPEKCSGATYIRQALARIDLEPVSVKSWMAKWVEGFYRWEISGNGDHPATLIVWPKEDKS